MIYALNVWQLENISKEYWRRMEGKMLGFGIKLGIKINLDLSPTFANHLQKIWIRASYSGDHSPTFAIRTQKI